jgi:hypothetical protein
MIMETAVKDDRLVAFIKSRIEYFKEHPLTIEEIKAVYRTTKGKSQAIDFNCLYQLFVYRCNKIESDLEYHFLNESYDIISIVKKYLDIERARVLEFAKDNLTTFEHMKLSRETSNYLFGFFNSFNENADIY